jgi:transcriptional regulator with XRE-family HTH domain
MKKELLVRLGSRVIEVRGKLGLKQKDFAKVLGVSASYLSDIELGKTRPSFDFLISCYNKYKLNINWLLVGDGTMFRYSEQAGDSTSTFPLDKFRRDYSRVNEEIDEFLFYFFKSDFFRFMIMAESIKIRNESAEFINNEINRKNREKQ